MFCTDTCISSNINDNINSLRCENNTRRQVQKHCSGEKLLCWAVKLCRPIVFLQNQTECIALIENMFVLVYCWMSVTVKAETLTTHTLPANVHRQIPGREGANQVEALKAEGVGCEKCVSPSAPPSNKKRLYFNVKMMYSRGIWW